MNNRMKELLDSFPRILKFNKHKIKTLLKYQLQYWMFTCHEIFLYCPTYVSLSLCAKQSLKVIFKSTIIAFTKMYILTGSRCDYIHSEKNMSSYLNISASVTLFQVWLWNRLISAWLEPVLNYQKKSCIPLYYI